MISAEAQEWLDIIKECDGAEVQEEAWSIVQELIDADLVELGSARGPGRAWKRAVMKEKP